jgi:hypothetical protein
MPGALLQLVSNDAAQNVWINQHPQITLFKKIYRRHTPFTSELIPVPFNSPLDFGKISNIQLPYLGDLIHRIFFVFDLPEVAAMFLHTKSQDIVKVIRTITSDKNLRNILENYILPDDKVDMESILNVLDETIDKYRLEEKIHLEILSLLDRYHDSQGFLTICNKSQQNYVIDLESELTLHHECKEKQYDIVKFKMDLEEICISKKDRYYLVYELIKLMFLSNKKILEKIPIINRQFVRRKIKELLPHKCILEEPFLPPDFGPQFYDLLNLYNVTIAIVKTLATTVPIVLMKVFHLTEYYDIYQNSTSVKIDSMYFPTIIDPNFKAHLISKVNDPIKIMDDGDFLPVEFQDINDQIYPNEYDNPYLKIFNEGINNMFSQTAKMVDILFEKYRDKLFSSTEKMFYQNSTPLSNIYSYLVPKSPYQDKKNLRITNVFNINIWYFYFFKYLDLIDESSFSNYIRDAIGLSEKGTLFLKNLITLLKINIEYYMNEISYLLNDLYASCPSIYPSDSMKNYSPPVHDSNVNGISIYHNLIAITIIMHRNHVPSILEMFQYIYHFVSVVDIDRINRYLDLDLPEMDPGELNKIRRIVRLLYYQIFGYFMNVYDSLRFESPANFTTNEYDQNENIIIKKYVAYLLTGDNNWDLKYFQPSLVKVVPQMEFYFVLEMINMREIQKLYYNVLFNKLKISEVVGQMGTNLVELIIGIFKKDMDITDFTTDRTRKYWDKMYQYDGPYYKTTNLDRFDGNSYLKTPYMSRNFGRIEIIDPPIPLPPTNPYGINPKYYDHIQTVIDISSNAAGKMSEIQVLLKESNYQTEYTYGHQSTHFQLFDIDYFRIKHEFLLKQLNCPNNNVFVDTYQFNLIRFARLAERMLNNGTKHPSYLLYWMYETLVCLIRQICHSIYVADGTDIEYFQLLKTYLHEVENGMFSNENVSRSTCNEMLELAKKMLKHLDQNTVANMRVGNKIYTHRELELNNNFVKNLDFSNGGLLDNLTVLRDSFLAQYFYYSKYYDQIMKLWNLDDDFYLSRGIMDILSNVVSSETNYAIVNKIHPLSFIYPELFFGQISMLVSIWNRIKDFDQFLLKLLVPYFDTQFLPRTTIRDIQIFINTTFVTTKLIYQYLEDHNLVNLFMDKISIYQPLIIKKMALFCEICGYFEIDAEEHMRISIKDIEIISNIAQKYGISYSNFYNYLSTIISSKHRIFGNNLELLITIYYDLDSFIIPENKNVKLGTFKNLILHDMLESNSKLGSPVLERYLNLISNEYYAYIYFFIHYLNNEKIDPTELLNPLISNTIFTDVKKEYYDNFSHVSNVLEYLMDYLWDNAMHPCYGLQISNIPEYPKYPSWLVNQVIFSYSKSDTSVDLLEIRSKIVEIIYNTINKGIILIYKWLNEAKTIRNKIGTILYRNKKGKMAWIRKLGHYIIDQITIKFGDQICDTHTSDWIECFHEISKNSGTESGYLKMIGHRKDLITFDDKVKNTYTIAVPLIFYFNRNVGLSLPLNASMNTQYEISIKLKKLEELLYHEEFSDIVDPKIMDLEYSENTRIKYSPSLINPHLMVEYIYLSSEEREIFASRKLEYLIEETQLSHLPISDQNLLPVYMVRSPSNKKKCIFCVLNQNTIDSQNDLLSRKDYLPKKCVNRHDIEGMMIDPSFSNIDSKIHRKRIIVDNQFHHPCKMMAILFKSMIHIDPTLRQTDANYFHGERQWDNYGLYSYYDLTKIIQAREMHYRITKKRINDSDDPIYGILNIVNQILLDRTNMTIHLPSDEYFLEALQRIKDAYLNYRGILKHKENIVKLKEYFMSIPFNITISDKSNLFLLLKDICNQLNIDLPEETEIATAYDNVNINKNFELDNKGFKKGIIKMFDRYIKNALINKHQITKLADDVFQNFIEAHVNILINLVDKTVNIGNFGHNVLDLLCFFVNFYSEEVNEMNVNLSHMLKSIMEYLPNYERFAFNTKNIMFKDIIHQILYYDCESITDNYNSLIPYRVVNQIALEMARKLNQIINDNLVDLIDFQKNMVENPRVNPLISGQLQFNGVNLVPDNVDQKFWSEMTAYLYFDHTPSTGINLYSWSLRPLIFQPSGSANLSKIDQFRSIYDVHPLIGTSYPAIITTFLVGVNVLRYLSGMCGKTW